MNANEYQRQARQFAVYPNKGNNEITYPALGLAGEAGEVANQVKKVLRDDGGYLTGKRLQAIEDELGDVLWYVANLAEEIGSSVESIMEINISKLAERRQNDLIHGDKRKNGT